MVNDMVNFLNWVNWGLVVTIITMGIASMSLKVSIESKKSYDRSLKLTGDLKELFKENLTLLNETKKINEQSLEITNDNLDLTKEVIGHELEVEKKETLSQIKIIKFFCEKIIWEVKFNIKKIEENKEYNYISENEIETIELLMTQPPLNNHYEIFNEITHTIRLLNETIKKYYPNKTIPTTTIKSHKTTKDNERENEIKKEYNFILNETKIFLKKLQKMEKEL